MQYTDLPKGPLPAGGYLFYGEEDYLKQHTLGQVRAALFPPETDGLADFNRYSFTEENYTPEDLLEAILSPAMMVEKKLIEIALADADRLKEKDRTALCETLDALAQVDDTVCILLFPADTFDAGTAKRPSSFLKALLRTVTPVEFPRQSDPRLLRWAGKHLDEYGVTMTPEVGQLFLEICGRSMFRLSGELAKAGAYAAAHGMTVLTEDVVRTVVTTTPEDDAFRLANCILSGDRIGAYECLALKIRQKEDPVFLLSQITRVYMDLAAASAFLADNRDRRDFAAAMKMHEYKASLYYRTAESAPHPGYFAAALEACLETDLLLKSSALGYEPLERLVGRL